MSTLLINILIYLLGGVTFIPLLIIGFLLHVQRTQPIVSAKQASQDRGLELSQADKDAAQEELKALPLGISPRSHEPDVASGYFAVCREYVAGGVNGKPPGKPVDRPASQVSVGSGESPSVYQSMYRSIFDRSRLQNPTIDPSHKTPKKSRNVFYVVIRLGLLMLYDDEHQLEVRHVISLEHYHIDVYGGGEAISEGELWVKRNCIRMYHQQADQSLLSDIRPFFLFSSNCSLKEDFYHAMLQNQTHHGNHVPQPLAFDGDHMIKLIRLLHASEDNLQTRWINALFGRLFLSFYKTSIAEQYLRSKINKKLSRVTKPAFINAIQIREIHLGDTAPFITGPKLRELTRDGDLTLEADVKYKGNAKIEIAATARIDFGMRFKTRQVELLLAVICRSLEGHFYFRIKPPPSNRFWFCFVTMPKIDLSVEPVISSRQITYSFILNAIESRIREVVNETLVYPNWDDIPFLDTLDTDTRGGLWQHHSSALANTELDQRPSLADDSLDLLLSVQEDDNPEETTEMVTKRPSHETLSDLVPSPVQTLRSRGKSRTTLDLSDEIATPSNADLVSVTALKAMRSMSFASMATPVLNKDQATMEVQQSSTRNHQSDATHGLQKISSRSQPGSPDESPVGSPSSASLHKRQQHRSISSNHSKSESIISLAINPGALSSASTIFAADELSHSTTEPGHLSREPDPSQATGIFNKRQTFASTAAAARKWGLGFVNRHSPSYQPSNEQSEEGQSQAHGDIQADIAAKLAHAKLPKSAPMPMSMSQPIGRGQPLPPPGQPLPGPKSRMTWSESLALLGRKKGNPESRALPSDLSAPTTLVQASLADKTLKPPASATTGANDEPLQKPKISTKKIPIPRSVDAGPLLRPRASESNNSIDDDSVIASKAAAATQNRRSSMSSTPADHCLTGLQFPPRVHHDDLLPLFSIGSMPDPHATPLTDGKYDKNDIGLALTQADSYDDTPRTEFRRSKDRPHRSATLPVAMSSLSNPSRTTSSPLEAADPPSSRPLPLPPRNGPEVSLDVLRHRKARSPRSLLPTPVTSPRRQSPRAKLLDKRTSAQSLQGLLDRKP